VAGVGNSGLGAETNKGLAPAVVLFGSPGSGKGTQAKLLRHCLNAPHISTGDMLRVHIGAKDEIGREAERLIKAGKLVPDKMVNGLVETRIGQPDCKGGIILDGYPRTVNQARALLSMLVNHGFRPGVVHLVVDYEKIVARLSGRRQCPVCGTLYSSRTNPPKIAGKCDLDGAALVTREDDRESVIRERLREYDQQTRPVLSFFKDAGVPVFEIDGGEASPAEIMQDICNRLADLGLVLNAAIGPRESVRP
jgi:adenylate kinase